ncbi:LysM peptidoglycan-binding domain-containing protein [Pseudomonas sp. MIL19]|uniref:FimV/HubP family polar landmark protein n=1 Tax=Pseudomonas sp. MIL19 TaxID=2976979 RepID=UPI002363CDAB|nr:FimV/HubP family polar landmark protein [Pseudomonas sp. MIL19]MDD2161210.1 LysM peptidoglycan-binding domain-containing protein [Pseudomonas sp. MIL19]
MAKVRQLLIGLASGSALYSGLVPALGLGEITLHSALSQPLDAEIELFDVGDLSDADMRVRLAPADVFSRSGVERLYFFNSLRFTPLLRGGKSVIRVVSTQVVREPYLNFIVEVARPSGKLYREYTVLLDPPSSAAYNRLPEPSAVPATPRSAVSERAQPKVLPAAQQGNSYSVVSGDSLWKIATRLTADTGQAPQALMDDIQALNPQAFIEGDVSRLRAGAKLLLPDRIASAPSSAAKPAVAEGFLQVVEDAEAVPAPAVSADLPAEVLIQEQARVEQELAIQTAETLQLQQSLAQLSQQVQQLQEQMSTRDQQIADLQAELAASRASAAAAVTPVAVAVNPPVAPESGSNWLGIIAGLLVLLLAAVAGLFWRARKPLDPAPLPVMPAVIPNPPKAQRVVPAEPAVAVSTSPRDATRAGPVWPAAGEDALQSANVYIAYGRLNEAASTLERAWEAQPQRSDIGFRLLEVLALLGDAQGFNAQELRLRESGFNPVRIDELKARHAELLDVPSPSQIDDMVLQLDEVETAPAEPVANDVQLNLDEMSLDADWDLVSPFAPAAKSKALDKPGRAAEQRKGSDIFEPSARDARSPFAESMLVEESSHDSWDADELNVAFLDDIDELADSNDNVSKLNTALAYIEQGSLDSACQILNEVINEGDEQQKQEARQLLAKIA